jgi:hypothetical protein
MVASNPTHYPPRRIPLAALAACLGSVVGCYRYAPVQVTDLAPAMTVRMELSAAAVDRLRHGPDSLARLLDGFNVSGSVSRLTADSVLLAVPTSYMEANVRLRTQLHDLPLLRSDVQRVRSRRLDRNRTAWAGVGLGVAAAASVAYVLNHGGRATGSIPKPVDPTDNRIPTAVERVVP